MKKFLLLIVTSLLASTSYASVTDDLILVSKTDDIIKITSATTSDDDLILSQVNNHELKVVRENLHSGDYVVNAKIGRHVSCTVKINAHPLGESIKSFFCNDNWTGELKREGISNTWYLTFSKC